MVRMHRLIVTAVVLAAIGYVSHVHIEEGFSQPWKVTFMCSAVKFVMFLVDTAESMHLVASYTSMRLLCGVTTFSRGSDDAILVEDVSFDGVKVRLYTPRTSEGSVAGMVYFHGGGFTFGSPAFSDPFTRKIARDLNIVLVSVDYRLTPEHPYPAPFEDSLKGTLYFMRNAAIFGVDPDRICLAGDSAGGNLAAAISLKLRDSHPNMTPARLQILLYPSLQAIDLRVPSMLTSRNTPLISPRKIATYWLQYALGEADDVDNLLKNRHTPPSLKRPGSMAANWRKLLPEEFTKSIAEDQPGAHDAALWQRLEARFTDPYFAPLMAANLTGLPAAYVHTARGDPLRDDGWMYAKRLSQADVDVTHVHKRADFHDMMIFPHLFAEADVYLDELIVFLGENL